jgi:hypothetical protein
MTTEFCKDDAAPVVRECPACIDKYIALAERYQAELKSARTMSSLNYDRSVVLERERDAARLQLDVLKKKLAEYGHHKNSCATRGQHHSRKMDCDCGFSERMCPSTHQQGTFKCEKDEAHLHRIGDVEHKGGGKTWMSL